MWCRLKVHIVRCKKAALSAALDIHPGVYPVSLGRYLKSRGAALASCLILLLRRSYCDAPIRGNVGAALLAWASSFR